MGVETAERIRVGAIRSVLREAALRKRRDEEALFTQDLMDALEELTNLPRLELEQIAERVGRSHHQEEDPFFSIRQQVALASATVLGVLSLPLMAVWLF
jgi:serine/threonine protein kinase HipA of HipAB toxin-antitoxin module